MPIRYIHIHYIINLIVTGYIRKRNAMCNQHPPKEDEFMHEKTHTHMHIHPENQTINKRVGKAMHDFEIIILVGLFQRAQT